MRPTESPTGTESLVAKLIYSVIASLDGYIEDEAGSFDWAEPDREVLEFVNDLESTVGTYLYGRRMYETMLYWESAHTIEDLSPRAVDFTQLWQAADKIVYSSTLESVSSKRTRLERTFDPEAIALLKDTATLDLTVGGPELAAQALAAGLVDECQLFVVPVVVGSGKSALPSGVRLGLELQDLHRFPGGFVYLNYALRND
jgi:dihydrofolate reductase